MRITIEIADADVLPLRNDLPDIDDWVQKAVRGKVNRCRKRMIRKWWPRLRDDPEVETIPASEDELIALIVARPDYLDRVAQEAAALESAVPAT